jgi:subtilisin family serine protease
MRLRGLLFAALVTLALVPAASAGVIRGQYVVVLKQSVDVESVAAEHARRAGADVFHTYTRALKGYAARLSPAGLARVRADSRVLLVSQDRAVSIAAQSLPTGINRIEGDSSSTQSGNGSGSVNVPVAVIDTGIDLDHPDLNVVGGKNCSTGRSYDDGNGHGTHVAGTIGARDNGIGVVGMAPGVPLYAVRVLNNNGSGSWSSVVCGIDWVTANAASKGIRLANMSLGGTGSDTGCNGDALHKAICNSVAAGITYAVAAGNSALNLKDYVPAAYDEVLTVTAVADFNGQPGGGAAATCRSDVDDTAADFSNFTTSGSGDEGHTIAAPGVCILSSWRNGGYNTISGTSMASPHVAGTAALCLAGPCAGMTPSLVMSRLRADAEAQPAGYGFTGISGRSYGRLAYAGGY